MREDCVTWGWILRETPCLDVNGAITNGRIKATAARTRSSTARCGRRSAKADATGATPNISQHFDGKCGLKDGAGVRTGQVESQQAQRDGGQACAQHRDDLCEEQVPISSIGEDF